MYKLIIKKQSIRNYMLAGGISRLGDSLAGMAFLFLAYELTESTLLTSVMAMAETVPYLLFGLVGGAIADVWPTKKVLILSDMIRIPLALAVVLLYEADLLYYPSLLLISFLIQSVGCFFNPAHRLVLPQITNLSERTAANSLYDTLTRGVTVLSPILSIWLIDTFGFVHFFTVDAITYLVSAVLIYKIPIHQKTQKGFTSLKKVHAHIREFACWSLSHAVLKRLFLSTFVIVLLNTWVWDVGLLIALNEMSQQPEKIYTTLQGVYGITVILTNILIPFFFKKMSLKTYFTGTIIWGTGLTYYALLYDIHHFFIGVIIVGIGLPLAGLTRVYLLQTIVPDDKLGRAFSFNAVLLYLANTLALFICGFLATLFSVQLIMIVNGALILTVSIMGFLHSSVLSSKHSRRFMVNLFK